jgi:hypothetical protein
MSEKKILKNGIWIKEQNGILTMGLLDDDFEVEIGEKTSLQLFALELELQEALFGDNITKFNPEVVNFEKLVQSVRRELKLTDNDIYAHFSGPTTLKADFKLIFDVFKSLIQKSLKSDNKEKIYINASVADKSLCIVYRDEFLCKKGETIEDEKNLIENELKGKIKINDSVKNPYIDITIPEKA